MSYESVNNFEETRHRFEAFLHYDRQKSLSFDSWANLARDHMVAALYCNFYDEIMLAWYKVRTNYSYTSDGVDEILQYLAKNVDKILENPKRFTPQYIYRVAYNCLFCLCLDPNKHRQRYEHECSNITEDGTNIFDFIQDEADEASKAGMYDALKQQMWKDIEDLGFDAVVVVNELTVDSANGEDAKWSKFTGRHQWHHRFQKLKDSGELEIILANLRKVLSKYADVLGGIDLSDRIVRLSFDAWPSRYKKSNIVVQKELGDISPKDDWYRIYCIEYTNKYNNSISYTSPKLVYPDEDADSALSAYIEDVEYLGHHATNRVLFLGYYTFNVTDKCSEPTCNSTLDDFNRVDIDSYTAARRYMNEH